MRKKNKRRVVVDLNVIESMEDRQRLLKLHHTDLVTFAIPSFAMEELVGDGPAWPVSLHKHAVALLPILDLVVWTTALDDSAEEERETGKPAGNLISGTATANMRERLKWASEGVREATEAFPFVDDYQSEYNVRRDLKRHRSTFADVPKEAAKIARESLVRVGQGDLRELSIAITVRACRFAARTIPGFLNWDVERQKAFVAESVTCRAGAAAHAMDVLYMARGRSASLDGERERRDIYDCTYAIYGSLLAGLESNDKSGIMFDVYRALCAIPEVVAGVSTKSWIETVEAFPEANPRPTELRGSS